MPVMSRLFILDLDGTLMDSLDDLTVSVNVMRSSFALSPLGRAAVRGMVGQGARVLVQRALPGLGDREIEHGLRLFLAHNEAHLFNATRPYPGVPDTLAALAAQGHTLALLSNKNEGLCRQLLEHFGVGHHFAVVVGADTLPCRKPSPEPVRQIMSLLGRTAGETVMVGDSINDVAAGRGAQVITVGCTYGYGNADELAGAAFLIDSFAGLLQLDLAAAEVAG